MANGEWNIRVSDLKYTPDYSIYHTKPPVNAIRKGGIIGFRVSKVIRIDIDIPVLNTQGTAFGKTGVFEFNFDPVVLDDESISCVIDESHTVNIMVGENNGVFAVVVAFVNGGR